MGLSVLSPRPPYFSSYGENRPSLTLPDEKESDWERFELRKGLIPQTTAEDFARQWPVIFCASSPQ